MASSEARQEKGRVSELEADSAAPAGMDRSAETRLRLLEAAGPIFAERGLEGVTVREICGRAGVNIAAIHYHFGDKGRLYIAAVKYARERRAERYPFPNWGEDVSPEVRLRGFIETIVRRMLEPDVPWQTRLLMREVLRPTDACRALVEDYFRPDFESLVSIIEDLMPDGTTARCCRQTALSVLGQCLLYRIAGDIVRQLVSDAEYRRGYEIESLADHIWRFSLAACRGWEEVELEAQRIRKEWESQQA